MNLNVLTGCAVSGGSTMKIKIAISIDHLDAIIEGRGGSRDGGVDVDVACDAG